MKKKIFVCFGEKLGENKSFDSFSNQLVKDGFEIHLFDNLIDKDFQPYDVLTTLEQLHPDSWQENDYYFATDVKEFFILTYRVYQQSFCQFVFFSGYQETYDVEQNTIYDALISSPIKKEEKLSKPVFTEDIGVDFNLSFINDKKIGLESFTEGQKQVSMQKIYRFDEQCYLLEPVFASVIYINLDDKLISDGFKFSDIIMPVQLDDKALLQTEEALELIARDMQTCLRRIDALQGLFALVQSKIKESSSLDKCYYSSILIAISESFGIYTKIYMDHFLLSVFCEYKYYQKFLKDCLSDNELFLPYAYYAFMQINALPIEDKQDFDTKCLEMQTLLFDKICNEYKSNIDIASIELEKNQADKDAIVIIINQLLNASHKKSLYALDVCKYLIEKQNKKVWLFNTCEYLTQSQRIPLFNPLSGTIIGDYTQHNNIDFENTKIPYYQMITPMPAAGGIDGILEFFNDIKPSKIINLADFSVTAEVCSEFVETTLLSVNKTDCPVILNGKLITDALVDDVAEKIYAKQNVKLIKIEKTDANQELDENWFDEIWQKINN